MEMNIKRNICVCVTESLSCTPETQHCYSTKLQYKIKHFLKDFVPYLREEREVLHVDWIETDILDQEQGGKWGRHRA